MNAVEAVRLAMTKEGQNILCSWPSYDENWCYLAVRQILKGRLFVYIGEGRGGCTGDDALHDLLSSDFEEIARHPVYRFTGLHDCCAVYRRV
jgi:hypothetical protein